MEQSDGASLSAQAHGEKQDTMGGRGTMEERGVDALFTFSQEFS